VQAVAIELDSCETSETPESVVGEVRDQVGGENDGGDLGEGVLCAIRQIPGNPRQTFIGAGDCRGSAVADTKRVYLIAWCATRHAQGGPEVQGEKKQHTECHESLAGVALQQQGSKHSQEGLHSLHTLKQRGGLEKNWWI
jgi:hypothetical protein